MTTYLLDDNVLRELHLRGNPDVRRWYAGIAPSDLRISAMTFFEKRRGWERRKQADPDRAAAGLAALEDLRVSMPRELLQSTFTSQPNGRVCLAPRIKISATGRLRPPRGSMATSSSPETSRTSAAVESMY